MTDRPDTPEQYYQQHKKHTHLPVSAKKKLMLQARRARRGSKPVSMSQWIVAAGSGFAFLVLVGMWQWTLLSSQPSNMTARFVNVEMHGFENKANPSLADTFNVKQTRYYQDYAQRTLTTQARYQQQATVIEAVDKGALVLLTCSDTIIKVSEQLLYSLARENMENQTFIAGQKVLLSTSERGYILAIQAQQTPRQCG